MTLNSYKSGVTDLFMEAELNLSRTEILELIDWMYNALDWLKKEVSTEEGRVMDRYTKRENGGNAVIRGDSIYSDWGTPEGFRGDAIDRLAAYEDTGLEPEEITDFLPTLKEWRQNMGVLRHVHELVTAEAEGRLLVLPCKVGDMLYVIIDGKIYEGEVYHISYSDYYGKVTATAWTKGGVGGNLEDFGKTVFLTREAAETALKEREGT